MTTLSIFTFGAIVGGFIVMTFSHARLLGQIMAQDARIFRLQKAHDAAVVRQSEIAARVELRDRHAHAMPSTFRGVLVPTEDGVDSITCERG